MIIANLDGRHGNEVFIANDTRENTLWVSSPVTSDSSVNDPASANREQTPAYRLSEEARLRGCATGPIGELLGCMGIATGDFDHNGTLDLYVTNYYNEASNLYLQQDVGLFVDSAALFGARKPSIFAVGFGTQASDLDRDGWLDLVVLNGHAVDRREKGEPLQMKPQLFRGRAGEFVLLDLDNPFWKTPTLGRTLASLDWNRDGRPDMVANHLDSPLALLQNESDAGQWIQFELVGTRSERDAVGSKVTIECGDRKWVSWVTGGDGYLCTNEPIVDFGIDDAPRVDKVTIEWPAGDSQELRDLAPGSSYLVVEGDEEAFADQNRQ